MKKILLLSVLMLTAVGARAQSMELSLGTGTLLSGGLKLEGMYHIDDLTSFNLELRAINTQLTTDSASNTTTTATGFAISPEIMLYDNSDNGNEGLYLGAYLRFKSMETKDHRELDENLILVDADFTHNALGAGLTAGYHAVLARGITLRVYAGAGYNFVNSIKHLDAHESALSVIYEIPIHVRTGVNLGFRF